MNKVIRQTGGVIKIGIRNIIIGIIAAAPFWAIPSIGQAQVSACWPDGWESMEIEAKWETNDPSVPICNDDGTPNPNATYNKIVQAFPNGGTYATPEHTYNLNVRWDGISRKFVDLYYDNAGNELSNNLHVLRHRTRYTSRPLAGNNCPETLEQASWRKDWERVEYKSTPYLFIPVWFREEAGSECNVWDRQDEELCPPDWIGSIPDILAGNVPSHGAIVRLLEDHPSFDFTTNEPFLEVTQYRYRVEFYESGVLIYEMSLDQVIERSLPNGDATFSVEVEIEIVKENKDIDDITELFILAAQIQDEFDLIPSTRSKGGVEVPVRIIVPSGDVAALIAAINTANSSGESTIIHLEGGTYTLMVVNNNTDGANGLPSITSDITITHCDDANPIIERDTSEGTPSFRIFHTAGTGNLTLDGVTVRNGSTVSNGGGIFNKGTLTVKNGTISNNTALLGGGINNEGSSTLINCTIGNNTASFTPDITVQDDGGGGIRNEVGATLTLINCIVDTNHAKTDGGGVLIKGSASLKGNIIRNNTCDDDGAGIEVRQGNVTISNSTLYNNAAAQDAGGIATEPGSDVTLTNCSIVSNTAGIDGGGINNESPLTLINCTIARNRATEDGGGIENHITLNLINCTIASNSASDDGGGIKNKGRSNPLNTIIANNSSNDRGPDCHDDRDDNAITVSNGNNIIGNLSGFNIILQGSDRFGDPGLRTFTDNGTPGNGHFPLLATSQAFDNGTNDVFQDYPDTQADQLGRSRPVDGNSDGVAVCDIGAIESFPVVVVNDMVSEAKEQRITSYSPVPVPNGPAGTFTITATFTNTSNAPTPIFSPYFKVVKLTGGNLLLNADGGAGGVGATLTPDVGDDGVFSPGESFTAVFEIGLQKKEEFTFLVDLLGVTTEEQTDLEVASLDASQVNKQLKKTKSRTKGRGFFGRFRP